MDAKESDDERDWVHWAMTQQKTKQKTGGGEGRELLKNLHRGNSTEHDLTLEAPKLLSISVKKYSAEVLR